MAQKRETSFKEKVRKDLERLGNCWFVKIQQVGIRGTPDILACIGGYFIALELKADAESNISRLQIYELEKIKKAHGRAFIVEPKNWKTVYAELKQISKWP